MKKVIGMVALMVMGSGSAMADCDASQVTGSDLFDLVNGKAVNGEVAGGGEVWNEIHCASGELWKLGGVHADTNPQYTEAPSKVGVWSVNGTGSDSVVTYTYEGVDKDGNPISSPFSFTVHDNGGSNYSFCGHNNNTEVSATLVAPLGGC